VYRYPHRPQSLSQLRRSAMVGENVFNGQIVGPCVGPEGFDDLEPSGRGWRREQQPTLLPGDQGFGWR